MTQRYMNPPKRVTPASVSHQNIRMYNPQSSGSSIASDGNPVSLPELITYDIFEKKSIEQLLFESAQERLNPTHKWSDFEKEIRSHINSKKYSKHLVKNLDDKRQWAPLHYAVFNNNTYVCDKLTDKNLGDKHFRCDINILTGNGENVLHVAARSSFLWQSSLSSTNSEEPLLQADGNSVLVPAIIRTVVERGVDVNHPDDEGRTPLHLAVMENRLAFVKYLLDHVKVNIYALTKLHSNVLHFTFIPNQQSQLQLSAMFEYLTGKLKSIELERRFPWRNKQISLAQMCTFDNRTPLVLAICHPSITEKIVQKLLHDMRNNSEDFFNTSSLERGIYQTQIFIAIELAARRQIKTLDHLQPVVDVHNANIFNQFLHFPCRYNHVGLLTWLIEEGSKFDYVTKSPMSTVEKFDLNAKDHAGYTPLLTAVFYGSIDCVRQLLKYSSITARTNTTMPTLYVNIDERNADGENILHICAKHPNFKDLLDIIWDKAVPLKLHQKKDSSGNLPLHVAAGSNHPDMCERLLKLSTDLLHEKNFQGQTAAHVATEAIPHAIGPERHHIEKHERGKYHDQEASKTENDDEYDFGYPIVKLMWENTSTEGRRSGLFEKDDDRKTCLHLAAANGHLKIVKFLIEEVGFEVDVIADRRLSPLHLACENGHGEVIAYLIEHGASPTLRNADLYNCLEIAIVTQNKHIVEELLTLPNWRELMQNAQPIPKSEAYDTPMRKLIRYLPKVAIWLIDDKLTRTLGGQGKHVFKKVYDYEFYMDVYRVKQWHRKDVEFHHEEESFTERCHRFGCAALCYNNCCCPTKRNKENSSKMPYTDHAYTLIRNHPLIIASEQSQCPELVDHPYNTFLREQWYHQNGRTFYIVRGISFILYAAFVAIWTAIILMGKHPQYFYEKVGQNMTIDLYLCQNVSRTLTAASDSEALKTTVYKNLKFSLYAFLLFFLVENIILIFALFPRIFRTFDYILEIAGFTLTFVYIYDWGDWQDPLIFRCPVQYQLGSMGLLIVWFNVLTYIKRTTWFDMGVFVVMIQLIGLKFLRFIPVLLVIICGFGFTHWMLLQNQTPFQTPVEALIRTALLMFDLGYEDHLYESQVYYKIVYVITILSAVVFCIFVLNLLISVAVGEIPSLTIQGKIWQSQMLYELLSDYSIISIQLIHFINLITCGSLGRWLFKKRLQPVFILEHDQKGKWHQNAWNYVQKNFFDEKIQEDIIPEKTSDDTKKDEK